MFMRAHELCLKVNSKGFLKQNRKLCKAAEDPKSFIGDTFRPYGMHALKYTSNVAFK